MRQRIIISALALLLIIVAIVALVVIRKKGFQASENLPTAEVSITITENGEPATGQLLINGDCPATELGAVDGGYYCALTTTDPSAEHLAVRSLSFFSYATDQTLRIPLQASTTTEPEPFLLVPGEKLILDVAIDGLANDVVIRRWNEATNQFEAFPPPKA